MKILFTDGGTGGHIFPIIAIVREIRKIYETQHLKGKDILSSEEEEKLEFYYIGPKDDFVPTALSAEGITVKTIFAGKIRRYVTFTSILQNLLDILIEFPGLIQAFVYIFGLSPDLIFTKGGYGSVPTVLSGWILQVPIFMHESDISPGFANKFLSKFVLEIFTSFPSKETEYFPQEKMITAGNPIRQEITTGSKEEAKKLFNLTGEKPVVLILGGSQGAQRINDMILQIFPEILMDFELIHQTGIKNFDQVKAEADVVITEKLKKYYHPYPFIDGKELSHAYQTAGLVVSRAGSASIFEIAAVGKPSILIPLSESAQNHQLKNAYFFALKQGAALVIEEPNLTPHFFLEKLKYLFFSNPTQLKEMGKRAKEFSMTQAARMIAEYLVDYLG